MGKAKRMVVVAKERVEARQSNIIASKLGFHLRRSKFTLTIGHEVTTVATANTSIVIRFASTFAVIASCKLVAAQVSSTVTAFASTIASTFAAVDIANTMDLLEPLMRCLDPYFSFQSFCLDSLLFL